MKKTTLLLVILCIIASVSSFSQIDTTQSLCASHIKYPFVSDGQQYQSLLNEDETAEFYTTFFGGATYRITAYVGNTKGNLQFSLYDENRNLLYSNADYSNAPYWDFKFTSTVNCIIEAKIDSKDLKSGRVIMLIGFNNSNL